MDGYGRLSDGSAFGDYTIWSADAGQAGVIYLTGDVDGDGKDDLVYGYIVSSDQVEWLVRLSSGSAFDASTTIWRSDAGDVGDIFRLAEVDADGADDLVYGRPLGTDVVRWYVRLSTGSSFADYSTWVDDAGSIGDIVMLGDLGGDGDADLLYGRTLSDTEVEWFGRFSHLSD